MTKGELQEIVAKSKNIRDMERVLKRSGYHNARFYKPTKGTDLQAVANSCDEECDEADRGKYCLFASFGTYGGYEWIWLERTKKEPVRFHVSIWVRER